MGLHGGPSALPGTLTNFQLASQLIREDQAWYLLIRHFFVPPDYLDPNHHEFYELPSGVSIDLTEDPVSHLNGVIALQKAKDERQLFKIQYSEAKKDFTDKLAQVESAIEAAEEDRRSLMENPAATDFLNDPPSSPGDNLPFVSQPHPRAITMPARGAKSSRIEFWQPGSSSLICVYVLYSPRSFYR